MTWLAELPSQKSLAPLKNSEVMNHSAADTPYEKKTKKNRQKYQLMCFYDDNKKQALTVNESSPPNT